MEKGLEREKKKHQTNKSWFCNALRHNPAGREGWGITGYIFICEKKKKNHKKQAIIETNLAGLIH